MYCMQDQSLFKEAPSGAELSFKLREVLTISEDYLCQKSFFNLLRADTLRCILSVFKEVKPCISFIY